MGYMFCIRTILRVYIGVILRLGRKTFWVSRFAGLSIFGTIKQLLAAGRPRYSYIPKRGFHGLRPL